MENDNNDTTSSKDLSHKIDDFFDVRSLASVLLGFTFIEWIKALLALTFGVEAATMAVVWPIIFVIMVVVLANAGKKTNHDLKRRDFEERIEDIHDEQVQLKEEQEQFRKEQEQFRKRQRDEENR